VTIPFEQSSDAKFEIGHVLFIDISVTQKLLINELELPATMGRSAFAKNRAPNSPQRFSLTPRL